MVNVSRWQGKKVVGQKGLIVGEVEGVELDTERWVVSGLQIGLTNEAALEAGFKRPAMGQIVVMIPTGLIGGVGDHVTLKEAVRDLKDLVTYLGWR